MWYRLLSDNCFFLLDWNGNMNYKIYSQKQRQKHTFYNWFQLIYLTNYLCRWCIACTINVRSSSKMKQKHIERSWNNKTKIKVPKVSDTNSMNRHIYRSANWIVWIDFHLAQVFLCYKYIIYFLASHNIHLHTQRHTVERTHTIISSPWVLVNYGIQRHKTECCVCVCACKKLWQLSAIQQTSQTCAYLILTF